MIVSLLTGRKGSVGFPGKHFCQVGGHDLAYYPMKAMRESKNININYISTDDKRLMDMAKDNDIKVIERPSELASDKALSAPSSHSSCFYPRPYLFPMENLVLVFGPSFDSRFAIINSK